MPEYYNIIEIVLVIEIKLLCWYFNIFIFLRIAWVEHQKRILKTFNIPMFDLTETKTKNTLWKIWIWSFCVWEFIQVRRVWKFNSYQFNHKKKIVFVYATNYANRTIIVGKDKFLKYFPILAIYGFACFVTVREYESI